MKRLPYYLIMLTMALVLAACVRPLQEEQAPIDGITPTIAPLVIPNPDENTGNNGGAEVVPATEGAVEGGENAGTEGVPATEGAVEGGENAGTEGVTEGGEGVTEGGENAGNTEQPTTTNANGDAIHVVVSGDLMGRIAERYGVTVQDILIVNGLTNPDILSVGDQLIIPTSGTVVAPDGSTTNSGSGIVHYVQPGDTLFRIALTYGTTVEALAAQNNIVDVNALDVGQAISIP